MFYVLLVESALPKLFMRAGPLSVGMIAVGNQFCLDIGLRGFRRYMKRLWSRRCRFATVGNSWFVVVESAEPMLILKMVPGKNQSLF